MTAELDRALDTLHQEFESEIRTDKITHIGIYNCRRKNHSPTAPWSEHAWPNAADVHVADNATGDRVAAWMRSRPDLWSEVYWEIALHWDHVHGTANPRRNYDNQQVPPCAGGAPDPPPEDEMPYLPIEEGDGLGDREFKRSDVASIQGLLNELGAGLVEDGKYGAATVTAVATHTGTNGKAVYGSNYKVILRKMMQRYAGEDGAQGPAGPKGDKGDRGAKGPKGDPGPSPTGAEFSYD